MIGNFELCHTKSPLLAWPTPNDLFFEFLHQQTPTFGWHRYVNLIFEGGAGLFRAFGPSVFWSKQFGPCKKLIENLLRQSIVDLVVN